MKILIVRIGAFGDAVITTPLVRHLAQQGNEIVYLGSEQSEQVLRHNPHISKFILHKRDSITNDKLGEYFAEIAKDNGCDRIIDLCESIEVRLALAADHPQWNWPKDERKAYANLNYYEFTFDMASKQLAYKDKTIINGEERDLTIVTMGSYGDISKCYLPDMFFSQEEQDWAMEERKSFLGQRVIMWGLSGSGRNKTWPFVPYVVGDLVKKYKDIKVILVGGNTCQILECAFPNHNRIIKRCGEYTFRQSALLAQYVDLVVSPDTGFLHTAGCWETPKIGLLTHTTIENITKHFLNDFSLESKAPCAPCFRLISDAEKQCPIEQESHATLCMGKEAMNPEDVLAQIEEVLCHSLTA